MLTTYILILIVAFTFFFYVKAFRGRQLFLENFLISFLAGYVFDVFLGFLQALYNYYSIIFFLIIHFVAFTIGLAIYIFRKQKKDNNPKNLEKHEEVSEKSNKNLEIQEDNLEIQEDNSEKHKKISEKQEENPESLFKNSKSAKESYLWGVIITLSLWIIYISFMLRNIYKYEFITNTDPYFSIAKIIDIYNYSPDILYNSYYYLGTYYNLYFNQFFLIPFVTISDMNLIQIVQYDFPVIFSCLFFLSMYAVAYKMFNNSAGAILPIIIFLGGSNFSSFILYFMANSIAFLLFTISLLLIFDEDSNIFSAGIQLLIIYFIHSPSALLFFMGLILTLWNIFKRDLSKYSHIEIIKVINNTVTQYNSENANISTKSLKQQEKKKKYIIIFVLLSINIIIASLIPRVMYPRPASLSEWNQNTHGILISLISLIYSFLLVFNLIDFEKLGYSDNRKNMLRYFALFQIILFFLINFITIWVYTGMIYNFDRYMKYFEWCSNFLIADLILSMIKLIRSGTSTSEIKVKSGFDEIHSNPKSNLQPNPKSNLQSNPKSNLQPNPKSNLQPNPKSNLQPNPKSNPKSRQESKYLWIKNRYYKKLFNILKSRQKLPSVTQRELLIERIFSLSLIILIIFNISITAVNGLNNGYKMDYRYRYIPQGFIELSKWADNNTPSGSFTLLPFEDFPRFNIYYGPIYLNKHHIIDAGLGKKYLLNDSRYNPDLDNNATYNYNQFVYWVYNGSKVLIKNGFNSYFNSIENETEKSVKLDYIIIYTARNGNLNHFINKDEHFQLLKSFPQDEWIYLNGEVPKMYEFILYEVK